MAPTIMTFGAASARAFGFATKSGAAPGSVTIYSIFGANFSWVAPAGVTSVSVVAVGPGTSPRGSVGGGGGGLGYKNNIPVSPGSSYTVHIPAIQYNCYYRNCALSYSYFINKCTVGGGSPFYCCTTHTTPGGKYVGDGGGNGGSARCQNASGGAGAGGYSGNGGNSGGITYLPTAGSGGGGGGGYKFCNNGSGGGGGVGLYGQGSSGAAGTAGASNGGKNGSGGTGNTNGTTSGLSYIGGPGGYYGGGGGYGLCYCPCGPIQVGAAAGSGAVRIVWPGNTRQFPSTCVGTP